MSQANGPGCDGALTTGSDGLLKDVQVIDVDESAKRGQAECTQDIDAHLSAPYLNLDNKKVWDCNTCRCVTFPLHYQIFINHLCTSKQFKKCIAIIDQTTTLWHHQQAAHEEVYCKWAANNGFTSMLPMDTKHHQNEEAHQHNTTYCTSSSASISRQPSFDNHHVPAGTIVQYLKSAFCNAAIEWLVVMDQVSSFTKDN